MLALFVRMPESKLAAMIFGENLLQVAFLAVVSSGTLRFVPDSEV